MFSKRLLYIVCAFCLFNQNMFRHPDFLGVSDNTGLYTPFQTFYIDRFDDQVIDLIRQDRVPYLCEISFLADRNDGNGAAKRLCAKLLPEGSTIIF